jgi:hypothetical protein
MAGIWLFWASVAALMSGFHLALQVMVKINVACWHEMIML